jgi:hypothetical protein
MNRRHACSLLGTFILVASAFSVPVLAQESQHIPTLDQQAEQARITAMNQRFVAQQNAALRAPRRTSREAQQLVEKLDSVLPAPVDRTPEQVAHYAEAKASLAEANALVARLAEKAVPTMTASSTTAEIPCPDEEQLYPNEDNLSASFRKSFSQKGTKDYPEFIFNAITGRRYWLEANLLSPREITSVFAPSTFTTEKILIRVCGLHFSSKPSIAALTQAVPEGGPQVDNAIQTPAPNNPATMQTSIAQALVGLNMGIAKLFEPSDQPHTIGQDVCKQLKDEEAIAQTGLDKYEQVRSLLMPALNKLDPRWLPGQNRFFAELSSQIRYELSTQRKILDTNGPYSDVLAFRKSRDRSHLQDQALSRLLRLYSATVSDKKFMANWESLKVTIVDLSGTLKSYRETQNAAKTANPTCTKSAVSAVIVEQLSDTVDEGVAIVTDLSEGVRTLVVEQRNIADEDVNLNKWYAGSAVSVYLYLDPVSSNSLTEITFNVSDPWKPLVTPDFVAVALPEKDANPALPQKAETVTITTPDGKATTIEVQPPDTATSSTIDLKVTPTQTSSAGGPIPRPSVSIQIVPPLGSGKGDKTKNAASNTTSPGADATSQNNPASIDASAADGNIPLATHFFERHRFLNFTASGGLLVTRFTQQNYAVQAFPTSIVTTTTTVTSPTSTPPAVTVIPSTGSLSYANATRVGPLQQSAVVGFTWYPFGRDTYPLVTIRSNGTPHASTFAAKRMPSRFGLFVGTSVSSVGPFAIGPTFDIVAGMQLLGGVTLQQRNYLADSIVPCSGQGSNTTTATSTSSSTSPTGVTTTTTVQVQTMGGCVNPQATILSGTTVPINQSLKPAFGFGILLNSALFKTLGLIK